MYLYYVVHCQLLTQESKLRGLSEARQETAWESWQVGTDGLEASGNLGVSGASLRFRETGNLDPWGE